MTVANLLRVPIQELEPISVPVTKVTVGMAKLAEVCTNFWSKKYCNGFSFLEVKYRVVH